MHSFWEKNKDRFENLNKKKTNEKAFYTRRTGSPEKEDQKKRAFYPIICFLCHYWEAAEILNNNNNNNNNIYLYRANLTIQFSNAPYN